METDQAGDKTGKRPKLKEVLENYSTAEEEKESHWLAGMKTAFRRFLWIAAFIFAWTGICYFEVLIGREYRAVISMLISVLLFFLAIPVSIVFRMDTLMADYAVESFRELALLLALPVVLLNFLFVGAVVGWKRGVVKNRKEQ